ncbi:ATP-binding cassette domain-containing protein [Parasedimentitalea psychrophila]|uniref:ATP-binding cassette domain-containing protein n=2 Tax=Parasedimentitalea psychrophila TaxID=2997337 RepID=A0A9Y2P6M4_9RHOB|nr:ATP-binding cassette domain-containing protein [Parasedimentitalea psychrophila]
MTVRDVIGEPLLANKVARGEELKQRVKQIATQCGLDVEHLSRYPHAFSGGQRLRIAIARALILHKEFIVCDEAVTAIETQKTAPWFLHLSLLRPHPPFIALAPYNTMYPPDDMRDPCDPEAATDHPFLAYVTRHHLDLEGLDQADDPAGDLAYAPQILTYAQKMLSWRLAHADRTLTGLYLSANGPKRAMP